MQTIYSTSGNVPQQMPQPEMYSGYQTVYQPPQTAGVIQYANQPPPPVHTTTTVTSGNQGGCSAGKFCLIFFLVLITMGVIGGIGYGIYVAVAVTTTAVTTTNDAIVSIFTP